MPICYCNINKDNASNTPFYLGPKMKIQFSSLLIEKPGIFWNYATCNHVTFESDPEMANGIYLMGRMSNCIIKNFGKDGTSYISFNSQIGNKFSNIHNTVFENCILNGDGMNYFCPEDIDFIDCTIQVSEAIFKNCNFYRCKLIGNHNQIDIYQSFFDTVPFQNAYNHFYHCTLEIPAAGQEQFCLQSAVNYTLAVETVFRIKGACNPWAFKHPYVSNGMRFAKSVIELTSYQKDEIDLLINPDFNDVTILYKD